VRKIVCRISDLGVSAEMNAQDQNRTDAVVFFHSTEKLG
jgi:hypothetical protein